MLPHLFSVSLLMRVRSNLPGGFKARGVRVRNDDEPINPGEFRDIDVPGGDVRNSIIPLPYKEPSATLAQLLGVVVDSGRRFAQVADTKVADVNSQAPVGTTVALIEQGSKIISSIHKRLHYAQKQSSVCWQKYSPTILCRIHMLSGQI